MYVGGPTHPPAEPSVERVYQHTTYHFEANPFSTRCLAYFYQHIQDYVWYNRASIYQRHIHVP